jgi:diphthine-ammonia ligase
MTLRVAVLFSGGKDSTYATWVALHQGWDVSLITVRPRSADSLMFHHPNAEWTYLQAQAMGLPHDTVEIKGEDELVDLRHLLARMKSERKISGLVTGAVASDYQKTRFDNMCDGIGLKTYAPLWHKTPRLLVENLVKSGFRIILTAVAAKGLDESWLGREITQQEWSKLEQLSKVHGIHVTGEGGEYESFVLDAPNFTKSMEVEKTQKEWDGDSGRLIIDKASLRNKLGN